MARTLRFPCDADIAGPFHAVITLYGNGHRAQRVIVKDDTGCVVAEADTITELVYSGINLADIATLNGRIPDPWKV